MNEKNELIIYQDKLREIIYIIGSLLIIAASLFLIIKSVEVIGTTNIIDDIFSILILFIAFVDFVFFSYIIITIIKRKEALVVDKRGITDNSCYAAFGFIPWEEIEEIYIDSFFGIKMIELKIKNEKKYLNKLTWWKKEIIKHNNSIGHQTFCIYFYTTKTQPEKILPKIQELFKKYNKI